MSSKVVIVGSGQAGVQAALSLRDEGFDGSIVVVGEEAELPYQRPPLSKAYLLGKLDKAGLLLKAAQVYDDYRVTLTTGVLACAIDRTEKRVRLSDGRDLAYDDLILATGARQRLLDVPGTALDGVFSLRTRADADAVMARLAGARRAVVIGAGFIGLEFAAVARSLGLEVLVADVAPRPLGRALSVEMARFFEEQHVAWGVDFLFGTQVKAIHGAGKVEGVTFSDGLETAADIVLVGVGVIPNAQLAQAAGLPTDNGVVVDALMQTSDPAISAIGDCALHPNPFSAIGPVRLESVQNATDQGRCVASRIAGNPKPYAAVPWFWSDQGPLKLQIAGLGAGHDTAVVRGDPGAGGFSVLCFKEDRLLAIESVNRGPDHVIGRRLIAAGCRMTPAQAADEGVPLKAHLSQTAA